MHRFLFLVCLFLFLNLNIGQCQQDTLKKMHGFELSFGQSMLFISNSDVVNFHTQSAVVIPTSAMLFFIELRTHRKVRIPFFFNLPTESKQFVVKNQLVYEKASPTIGTGLEFKLFQLNIPGKSLLDMEIGPLASFGLDSNGKVWYAPVIATRLRIMKGETFIMYFGGSYAFGVNALGIFYGTGTAF
jgi:hypothetical protein